MRSHKKTVNKGALFVYILITCAVLAVCGGWLAIDTFYPLKYEDAVLEYSRERGLDPKTVCAVIATESRFDADAVSKKGAVGLMQIMPDTGEWIAEKLGMDGFDEEALKDPETNIRIGTWYLKFLFDRYGEERTVIAAYNAGHGKVDEWLGDAGFSHDGKRLYRIPFKETEKYVERVERAYEIYKLFYKVG